MLFSGLMQSPKLTDTSKMQTQLSITCAMSSSPASIFLSSWLFGH